jgi:hypothetical protein
MTKKYARDVEEQKRNLLKNADRRNFLLKWRGSVRIAKRE